MNTRSMSRIRPQLSGLEPRRLLSAGDPDWSFGEHGSVNVEGETLFSFAGPAVVPLASGDMLLVGEQIIRKADAGGAIDYTFAQLSPRDQKGFLSPPGIRDSHDAIEVRDLDVMDDGRFVVCASGTISRFHANGSPDTSFGSGGSRFVAGLATPLADVYRAAVRADGRIIVEGSTPSGLFIICGLTADGETDPAFTPFTFHQNASPSNLGALLLQDDGKVLLGADGNRDGRTFRMARFNANGSLDSTFADGGMYPVSSEVDRIAAIHDVAIDVQNRIVTLEPVTSGAMALRRLLPSGAVDTAFGGAAADDLDRSVVNFGTAHGRLRLKLDGNGRILIQDDYRLARLTDEGLFDPAFGQVTTSGNIFIEGLLPFDDGSVYVAGHGDEIEGNPPIGGSSRLYRLRADNTLSAISMDTAGVLSVVGTSDSDRISVFTPRVLPPFPEIVAQVIKKEVEARGTFGRAFGATEVSLVSISAGGGDDLIRLDLPEAAAKPATVSAGDGDDQIIGSPASDSLSGNAGSDRIDGRAGDDRLDGNGGRDKLRGEEGNDRLFGGIAGDWLSGGDGDDILFGELGDDYLDGSAGSDRVMGSDGNDVFVSDDDERDDLYGGGGTDVLIAKGDDDLLTDIETT